MKNTESVWLLIVHLFTMVKGLEGKEVHEESKENEKESDDDFKCSYEEIKPITGNAYKVKQAKNQMRIQLLTHQNGFKVLFLSEIMQEIMPYLKSQCQYEGKERVFVPHRMELDVKNR